MKQLMNFVAVVVVMMMALLITVLILGFIDRALFIEMTVKMVSVTVVLSVASAIIIKMTGVDKKKK